MHFIIGHEQHYPTDEAAKALKISRSRVRQLVAEGRIRFRIASHLQAKARQLCRRRGFSPSEQEDIEQELWLAVLQQAERFDPARARLETFLDRVISRAVAMLLRSRNRRKRGHGISPLSLENDYTPPGEELKPLSDTVSREDVARRLGTQSEDPIARLDQTEAIESVLARMPERLRDICRRLMTGTVASVARELGISRYQVRKALEEARPYFEEAGLQNYGTTRSASGAVALGCC